MCVLFASSLHFFLTSICDYISSYYREIYVFPLAGSYIFDIMQSDCRNAMHACSIIAGQMLFKAYVPCLLLSCRL